MAARRASSVATSAIAPYGSEALDAGMVIGGWSASDRFRGRPGRNGSRSMPPDPPIAHGQVRGDRPSDAHEPDQREGAVHEDRSHRRRSLRAVRDEDGDEPSLDEPQACRGDADARDDLPAG